MFNIKLTSSSSRALYEYMASYIGFYKGIRVALASVVLNNIRFLTGHKFRLIRPFKFSQINIKILATNSNFGRDWT